MTRVLPLVARLHASLPSTCVCEVFVCLFVFLGGGEFVNWLGTTKGDSSDCVCVLFPLLSCRKEPLAHSSTTHIQQNEEDKYGKLVASPVATTTTTSSQIFHICLRTILLRLRRRHFGVSFKHWDWPFPRLSSADFSLLTTQT